MDGTVKCLKQNAQSHTQELSVGQRAHLFSVLDSKKWDIIL
jgi:hypothetical protein